MFTRILPSLRAPVWAPSSSRLPPSSFRLEPIRPQPLVRALSHRHPFLTTQAAKVSVDRIEVRVCVVRPLCGAGTGAGPGDQKDGGASLVRQPVPIPTPEVQEPVGADQPLDLG